MSFADDSPPSLSLFVRESNSQPGVCWANETVLPPPEHNHMRLGANLSTPGQPDFAQPDLTDRLLTMKELGLREAVTAPETITIYEACCLMSAGGADAVVLTDSNALLSGILTNKDIVSRVIAAGIDFANTPASKVMTKNPIFVSSDANPVEALRKMVEGEVTQLPIIENGEVIGISGLAKCLIECSRLDLLDEDEDEDDQSLVEPALRKIAGWNLKFKHDHS